MDLETKKRQAETYYSMGLLEESLSVYESILSDLSDSEESQGLGKGEIEKKIDLLEQEIKAHVKRSEDDLSSQGLSMIRESLPGKEDSKEILETASALKELGLIEQALSEYQKLLAFDLPAEKIVPKLTQCLLSKYSPDNASKRVSEMLEKERLEGSAAARVEFILAKEMEKRGYTDLAVDLYKKALNMDPGDREIKEKLDSLKAAVASGSRYNYLLHEKILTEEQLQKALTESKRTKKSVEHVLINRFGVKKKQIGESLSLYYRCPFKEFDPSIEAPVELIRNLKKSYLLHDLWVPLSWDKEATEVLVDDPGDLGKTDLIRGLMKTRNISLSVGIKEDIEQFIAHFFDSKVQEPFTATAEQIEDVIPDISFEEEEEETVEEQQIMDESSSQVVKLVDQVVVTAYRRNCSDIHIEPSPVDKKTDIRFRLDGVCQEYLKVPNSMARGILSRIKIMAGLDIAERRLPQDGKIKFKRKGIPPFELRVATLPTAGGFEDAVLRILGKAGAMDLDEVGLNERNLALLKGIIVQPYGLVLVVGPTGSGKTTTLHAALAQINKPGIKIWTAEDPVEITQRGLRQVEVKPKIGLDFARVMRSFLRADPDVIMIGEMRDQETASIAIEASLTGHLVFSTLHTNSASETVSRLLDMGFNAINFSDCFLGVLAQRLVRRLCSHCREPYHPSKEEFEEIVQEYGEEEFKKTGIKYDSGLTLYRAVGCEACSATGYKGRMGIHELMTGTSKIKKLIRKQAPSEDLFAQATKDGMTTLKQDGISKVFQGHTDMAEVRRVCIE